MDLTILIGLGEFFGDFVFIIKIFAFIAILGFVNRYIQNKLIKIIMVVFMGYFILIANWAVFGTMFVIYTLLGVGVAGIMTDFFFAGQNIIGEGAQEHEMARQKAAEEMERKRMFEDAPPVSNSAGLHRRPPIPPPFIRR